MKILKIIVTVVFSILAFLFFLAVIGCFRENNIPSGIFGVFLFALSVFFAVLPHIIRKNKNQIPPIQYQNITPVQNAVPLSSPSIQTAPAASPAAVPTSPYDDAREKRRLFIEKKKGEFSAALSAIPRSEIALSDAPAVRVSLENMPDFKSRNITRATRLETLFPLVVIDIETTGLNKRTSEIVEISAIKYSNGFVPVSCFTTLVKPKRPIPPEVSVINNITDDMVSDAPPLPAVLDSFSEFIRGCNVAGHNLIDFDLPFLFIHGIKFSEKVNYYDTLELSKLTLKAEYDNKSDWDILNRKLETLCDYYYIYRNDTHRSLSDCYATGLVLQHLIEDKTE